MKYREVPPCVPRRFGWRRHRFRIQTAQVERCTRCGVERPTIRDQNGFPIGK